MAQLAKPSNDEARLSFLKTAGTTAASDTSKSTIYISVETQGKLTVFSKEFEKTLTQLSGKLASRSKEVREKNEAVSKLETYIRDVWEGVKRRVHRNGEPAEVHTFYKLPLDGTVPARITEGEIFAVATAVIEGDKKAVEAGYPAAVNPTTTELKEVLATTQKEFNDVSPADRLFNEAQEALVPIRAQADEMIDDVIAELEFTLHKKDPSVRRRIMRTYGVTYTYAKGESEEDDTKTDTTAATANSTNTSTATGTSK
jgi:hypothetical protein